ncbi:hypothetical protein MIMGU_mgv1a016718mg [Erythranthe guttata]|uniref:Uncharacterized protein n=1 Tax=Erythranthe guttata TaxID=4155 RepID=A0A022Q472_ERYGU|nr:hypothetical protein MIMGU_mgv1a016718mg [Erythranthe guttata]
MTELPRSLRSSPSPKNHSISSVSSACNHTSTSATSASPFCTASRSRIHAARVYYRRRGGRWAVAAFRGGAPPTGRRWRIGGGGEVCWVFLVCCSKVLSLKTFFSWKREKV